MPWPLLAAVPGSLPTRRVGDRLEDEMQRFYEEALCKPFRAERVGPVRSGPRAVAGAEIAVLSFLGFLSRAAEPRVRRHRLPSLESSLFFFVAREGVWRTNLRRQLPAWVEHLTRQPDMSWERCLFLVTSLRGPVLCTAAYYRRRRGAGGGAGGLRQQRLSPERRTSLVVSAARIFSAAIKNLRMLADTEQSFHPKERELAVSLADLAAARNWAGRRYLARYGAPLPARDLAQGLVQQAARGQEPGLSRYRDLLDLLLLCLFSQCPMPRSEIICKLQFGVTLRRGGTPARYWLDLSNPFELAAIHKTSRFYYDRQYKQPLPLQRLRLSNNDGGQQVHLLTRVLDEWRLWSREDGPDAKAAAGGFVFSARYPGLRGPPGSPPPVAGLARPELLEWLLADSLARTGFASPERAATLRLFHLRKLSETFLWQNAGGAPLPPPDPSVSVSSPPPRAGQLHKVRALAANYHEHSEQTARQHYVAFSDYRQKLLVILDNVLEAFWESLPEAPARSS